MSTILMDCALLAALGQYSNSGWTWAKPKSCVSVSVPEVSLAIS